MKSFANLLSITLLLAIIVSCSETKTEVNSIDQSEIFDHLELLSENQSLLVLPEGQKTYFAPIGEEIRLLTSLGYKVNTGVSSRGEKCNLSKMDAAKEVGSITDGGGCAQVRKQKSGKYCVKEIPCQ